MGGDVGRSGNPQQPLVLEHEYQTKYVLKQQLVIYTGNVCQW